MTKDIGQEIEMCIWKNDADTERMPVGFERPSDSGYAKCRECSGKDTFCIDYCEPHKYA